MHLLQVAHAFERIVIICVTLVLRCGFDKTVGSEKILSNFAHVS